MAKYLSVFIASVVFSLMLGSYGQALAVELPYRDDFSSRDQSWKVTSNRKASWTRNASKGWGQMCGRTSGGGRCSAFLRVPELGGSAQRGFNITLELQDASGDDGSDGGVFNRIFLLANVDDYGAAGRPGNLTGYQITATNVNRFGTKLKVHRFRNGQRTTLANIDDVVGGDPLWARWQRHKSQKLTIKGSYEENGVLTLAVTFRGYFGGIPERQTRRLAFRDRNPPKGNFFGIAAVNRSGDGGFKTRFDEVQIEHHQNDVKLNDITVIDSEPPTLQLPEPSTPHPSEALRPWTQAEVRPVLPDYPGHSLHTYFNINPESPDGESVLVYVSKTPKGHHGQIWVVDRKTGERTVLAKSVNVEDPHRQANQQWVANGDYVVYMNRVDGEWQILRADTESLKKTVLAKGRQLGWGQQHLDVVPLYGPHWDPGSHRDLEVLNVRTGRINTHLTADAVVQQEKEYIIERFGGTGRTFSIFFPTLSPNGNRVFFKMSSPNTGVFRSGSASDRHGIFVYDLARDELLGVDPRWDHPAWYADSRRVLVRESILDTNSMTRRRIEKAPLDYNHAAPAPNGRIVATDYMETSGRRWVVAVIDHETGEYQRFVRSPGKGSGSRSWRKVHPHPAFNAAGNRVYFNVMLKGGRTVLYVAEAPEK